MKKKIFKELFEDYRQNFSISSPALTVDALKSCTTVRAIFIGESWQALKDKFDANDWGDEPWVWLGPIWKDFFSIPLPNFIFCYDTDYGKECDVNYNLVEDCVDRLQVRILNIVYEVENE